MSYQQGDIRLFQTDDGGDISVIGGVVAMDGGLETTVYVSLFGGNEDDSGDGALGAVTWWGNLVESEAVRRYRSETQYLLRALEMTSANLRRIEDAANRDLAWLLTEDVASAITVEASIIGPNRIQLSVAVEAFGDAEEFVFAENWKASV